MRGTDREHGRLRKYLTSSEVARLLAANGVHRGSAQE